MMKKLLSLICSLQLLFGFNALHATAAPLPIGEVVMNGTATFDRSVTDALTITNSNGAIIHWSDFSIGYDNSVHFNQAATSTVLNRVTGGNTSWINGALTSPGSVILLNENGILIGPDGTINAHSFIASTLDLSDSDFIDGGSMNFVGSSTAHIENLGTIEASSGDVMLIARTIDNGFIDGEVYAEGQIYADNGRVGLYSGQDVFIPVSGNALINTGTDVDLDDEVPAINNAGTIEAAQIALDARGGNVYALAINNSGNVRATSTASLNGTVHFLADGAIAVTGPVSADIGVGGSDVTSIDIIGGPILIDGEENMYEEGGYLVSTDGGDITIIGDASDAYGAGVIISNYAEIDAGYDLNDNGGNITISGIGGAYNMYGESPFDILGLELLFPDATDGVFLAGAVYVYTDGTGSITIDGTSGSSDGAEGEINVSSGVNIFYSHIDSEFGSISINGTAGADSFGYGIFVEAGSTIMTQGGSINASGSASGGFTYTDELGELSSIGINGIHVGEGVDVFVYGSGNINISGSGSLAEDIFLTNGSQELQIPLEGGENTIGGEFGEGGYSHLGNINISADTIYNDPSSPHRIITGGDLTIISNTEEVQPVISGADDLTEVLGGEPIYNVDGEVTIIARPAETVDEPISQPSTTTGGEQSGTTTENLGQFTGVDTTGFTPEDKEDLKEFNPADDLIVDTGGLDGDPTGGTPGATPDTGDNTAGGSVDESSPTTGGGESDATNPEGEGTSSGNSEGDGSTGETGEGESGDGSGEEQGTTEENGGETESEEDGGTEEETGASGNADTGGSNNAGPPETPLGPGQSVTLGGSGPPPAALGGVLNAESRAELQNAW